MTSYYERYVFFRKKKTDNRVRLLWDKDVCPEICASDSAHNRGSLHGFDKSRQSLLTHDTVSVFPFRT